jgi:hypothetical protein
MKKLLTIVVMALIAINANARTLLYEKDWTGGFEGNFPSWYQFGENQEGSVTSDPNGVAITVGSLSGKLWQPRAIVLNDVTLEKDCDYIVKVTAKFPGNGALMISVGT